MRLIGIDPGGTTGVCIYDQTNGKRDFYFHQIDTSTDDRYFNLFHQLTRWNCDVETTVVLEQFNFRLDERDRTKIVYTPAEVVGVVKLWCHINTVPYEMQMASEAKAGFWGNDEGEAKLRRLGLWKPSNKHAMDALKHVMQYLTFTLNDEYYLYKLRPTS